jgi:hypothetical protein
MSPLLLYALRIQTGEGDMQIRDEQDVIRIEDALHYDDVMVMVGDPDTGRPLLTLSVTKEGTGIIEYEPKDLAAGIVQLNRILAQATRGQVPADEVRTIS